MLMMEMISSYFTTDDGNEDNRQQPQIYAKNSMDRFGDDLCGLLLSYLTFEDRFRYECVSKQFQRTVFKSVVDISINDQLISHKSLKGRNFSYNPMDLKIVGQMLSHMYDSLMGYETTEFNTQLLATIARKCPNIQTIDCRGIGTKYEEHIPEMLNIFRGNSRHLREIYCNLGQNSDQLCHTFGPLVTRIDRISAAEKQSLIHCHQLSRLHVFSLSDVFDNTSQQLLAKNLTKLLFGYNSDDNQLLSAFVAQNQSLKSLVVFYKNNITPGMFPEMSKQLSRLTQLRELRLISPLIQQNLLSESLRTIGLNCKQLKHLSFELRGYNPPLDGNALLSLRCYHRLKRFGLTLFGTIDEDLLEPLKLCHRLTHLTLYAKQMNYKLFDNCDKNWPRLQYFCLKVITITDELLDHISRLPALQFLRIVCRHDIDIKDNDFSHLLSRSTKLKNIEIRINKVSKY
ncbi:unnamed protein product [Medioppia subpectinata]|uniref:F-box domain-containing protein n=1 Tax=Medioppia subpectinata TaxID=1979941 RepID=A0A7R9KCX3_9ACAR|nr:unnamed protein product [Medioppia subpectinata]CAG2100924.1 unnamed protein product [Medioppia subpectinata]